MVLEKEGHSRERCVISSGSYGCVIFPPVVNDVVQNIVPYKDISNNDISKIFKGKKKHFTDEVKFLQKVSDIDPKSTFTTKFKGANEIKNSFLSNPTLECLGKKKNSYFQIILEDGGIPVNIQQKKISYVKFLYLFRRFLEGMTNLQSHKLVHRDIKPDNVLINDHKISLIDFGLSTDAKNVYKASSMYILNYKEYMYYPPEFFIAAIMLQNKDLFEENFEKMKYHLNRIMYYMETNEYFNREDYNHNDQYRIQTMKGILEFVQYIIENKYSQINSIFTEDIALKSDVYSIAHIIVTFHKFIDYQSNDEKKFIDEIFKDCIKANPYARISMNDLYTKVSREYMLYVDVSKKEIRGGRLQKTFCDKMKSSYADLPTAKPFN